MEPSNDTPFHTTLNLVAMSVGLEKIEQSQDSNDTPLVPSQARTLHTELDKSSHLNQMLDEYTKLQKNLIDEIQSEQYMIQQDSRKSLRLYIDNAHNSVVRLLRVTYPYYYDANVRFEVSGKHQMQPTRVGGLAEIDAEIDAEDSLHVEVSNNFESKPTVEISHLSPVTKEPLLPK